MNNKNLKLNTNPAQNFKYIFFGGYTIIEMMIAISIFLIVVTIGMNGLLQSNLVLNKSRDMRNIMDNLSFIMEDMSRSIRTGYNYRCYYNEDGKIWDGNEVESGDLEIPRSCTLGHAIAFEEASTGISGNPTDQWIYKFVYDESINGFIIAKSINGGRNFYPLSDPKIVLSDKSGISILAAESQSQGNDGQPLVIIRISGEVLYKGIKTPFNLQTSVSQTLIDITL